MTEEHAGDMITLAAAQQAGILTISDENTLNPKLESNSRGMYLWWK